jgi:hypothetical protein
MVALSGNGWRLAPSLVAAAAEATRVAPNRSIRSDGSIGDTAHSNRISDHNPDLSGDVLAVDLTHDPAHGFDAHAQAENIRQRRDLRVKYVISAGRMFASYDTPKRKAWQWGTYTGPNGHFQHVHISVLDTPPAKNDTKTLWFSTPPAPQPPLEPEVDMAVSSAIVTRPNGEVVRFCKGQEQPAGKLWLKAGGNSWGVFNGSAGGRPDSALQAGSGPAATVDQISGKITVLVVGTDDKNYEYREQSPGGTWLGPVGVGGLVGS